MLIFLFRYWYHQNIPPDYLLKDEGLYLKREKRGSGSPDPSGYRIASCEGGSCHFQFQLADIFEDAIDIYDNYDNDQEIPGGIPYNIEYVFYKERSWQ